MGDFAKSILSAPLATLFVVAGILFLLIAVVGKFSGKIDPGNTGRIASGVLGLFFVMIGLMFHFYLDVQRSAVIEPPSAGQATVKQEQPSGSVASKPSDAKAPDMPIIASNPTAVTSTEAEPNDNMSTRNIIAEGRTVQGMLAKETDQDYFEFKASSSNTRVILRKEFHAYLQVYDSKEEIRSDKTETGNVTLSIVIETVANSTYYLVVRSFCCGAKGKYELTLRPE